MHTIVDKTDTLLSKPVASAILRESNLYSNPNNAYSFSITSISALEHAPIYTVSIGDKKTTDVYNESFIPDFRNIALQQFIKQVIDTTVYCMRDSSIRDFNESTCFFTIANALQSKDFQKPDNNYLYVYSDLFEHSDLFNIYTHANSSVVDIVTLFEATNLLPRKLTNTKVFFIYQPKNVIDDKRYATMFLAYKIMLEKRGAEIRQMANLK